MRIHLFAFFILLIFSSEVFACKCARQPKDITKGVSEAYESAASVVLAKVEFIKKPKPLSVTNSHIEDGIEYGTEITLFTEIKSWKGVHGKHFLTEINTMCCTCGIGFKEAEVYLLYLYIKTKNNTYATSGCSLELHMKIML